MLRTGGLDLRAEGSRRRLQVPNVPVPSYPFVFTDIPAVNLFDTGIALLDEDRNFSILAEYVCPSQDEGSRTDFVSQITGMFSVQDQYTNTAYDKTYLRANAGTRRNNLALCFVPWVTGQNSGKDMYSYYWSKYDGSEGKFFYGLFTRSPRRMVVTHAIGSNTLTGHFNNGLVVTTPYDGEHSFETTDITLKLSENVEVIRETSLAIFDRVLASDEVSSYVTTGTLPME